MSRLLGKGRGFLQLARKSARETAEARTLGKFIGFLRFFEILVNKLSNFIEKLQWEEIITSET